MSIGLSAGAVARIRFAVSPLWETVASVRVLRDPGAHAIHLPWARRHRGLRFERLWSLVPPGPRYVPDYLTPVPPGFAPELEDELALLAATPPEVVAAEGPPVDLPGLVDEIRAYFAVALGPDWPRIRGLLEAEVFARARALAADGVGGLLNDLHAQVSWAGDTLSVLHRWCTAADVPEGGDLVLVPSVFVWPSVLTVFGPAAQLAYPPRGVGALWEAPPPAPAALASVLGRARARLLVELAAPASTSALAERTGLTAGGVSQHLGALRAAGLVRAHRAGRTVLNVRTAVAEALLDSSAGGHTHDGADRRG
ncbi:helix-turn-helix domain-containing protein [Dactylosporangium sucinum]|uniref:helix-turn-helix domain-containing protein n=1 Tax=Dactylosporangium sucinum TaxID=1424081 RepID=UPI001E388727|nr:helix-turn-helix domain-containing protein [Dactylosporangium sucinum]